MRNLACWIGRQGLPVGVADDVAPGILSARQGAGQVAAAPVLVYATRADIQGQTGRLRKHVRARFSFLRILVRSDIALEPALDTVQRPPPTLAIEQTRAMSKWRA
jgi:hypothetical protein